MTSHAAPLVELIQRFSQLINPALALCVLGVLILATRKRETDARAWSAALLGIALVYILQSLDHHFHWWSHLDAGHARAFMGRPVFDKPHHAKTGSDYSTHSAMAAACLVPIGFLRPRAWPLLIAVLFAYAALMVWMGFHTVLDIISTLLVVVPLLLLTHVALLRKNARALSVSRSEDQRLG